jgi:hypothetical protein
MSVVVAFGLVSFSGALCADPLKYDVLSGGDRPAGPARWLTRVRLTFSTASLIGSELVGRRGWYSNFNDDKIGLLDHPQFTHVSGNDGFKADGGGYYDLHYSSDNQPASGLGAGAEVVYDITEAEGLTASDFVGYPSAPSGVQDLQGGGSSLVAAIPEPATVMLAGLGALGVALWARRRRRL